MSKILTVSCIGVGQRGKAYLNEMKKRKDKYQIVSLCDVDEFRLKQAQSYYEVKDENLFLSEDEFFKAKRSDILIVSTHDQDHVRQALKGLDLGYDILLEKPIAADKEQLFKLLKKQKETGRKIVVCHVLRYAPAFTLVKDLVDENKVGEIILIDLIENVGIMHQAHSYVRGNWNNKEKTSPMILAKCCHDLDVLTWFADSKCEYITSIGELNYFNKEHQPVGASNRCKNCIHRGKCIYDAYKIYIDDKFWGRQFITDIRPITDEALTDALDNGRYGRCVFACDNDVVDNQISIMHFENGITANLRMTAFSCIGGRILKIHGTKGQIILDETRGIVEVMVYGQNKKTFAISTLVDAAAGHGGGDSGIIDSLYDYLTGIKNKFITSLDASIQSHLMGLAAEESRLKNGEKIIIDYD